MNTLSAILKSSMDSCCWLRNFGDWLKDWSSVWGPIITLVGVFVAFWSLRSQAKQSRDTLEAYRTALKITTTLDLDYSFNSNEFKQIRCKAAQSIREGNIENRNVDDVLDFFEHLAFLLKRGIIDEETIWHTFFWWIHRYWKLSQAYAEKTRGKESTVWEDLPDLYMKLLKTEKEKNAKFNEELDADDMKKFLEDEINLTSN